MGSRILQKWRSILLLHNAFADRALQSTSSLTSSPGYIVLHEMMHGNVVAYTPNGNRHIKDLQQLMRRIDRLNGQFQWSACYGLELTKVMARTQTKHLGEYVTANGI